MTQQIIYMSVPITQKGLYAHFTVPLPDKVKNIVSVYATVNLSAANSNSVIAQIKNRKLPHQITVCKVRLNGAQKQEWFYDLMVRESIVNNGSTNFFTENFLGEQPYVFSQKQNPEMVLIEPATNRIHGYVKDCIGLYMNADLIYDVNIFLYLNN